MIFNLSIVDKNILKITGRPFVEGEDENWEEDQLRYAIANTINVIKYKRGCKIQHNLQNDTIMYIFCIQNTSRMLLLYC